MENEYSSSWANALGDDMTFNRPLQVSEVNNLIKELFDTIPYFRDIYIQGEISNFKNHYSTGHFYFTLKDDASAIRAVMFRSYASGVRFVPENGMNVTVHGRISAYPRDGQYQIYCDSMEPLGVGSLYLAFEQLKKKLASQGLFAEEHKKPLPKLPMTVGVVTSATGAAVQDIKNVLGRRCPLTKVLIYPALVQGDGAAESVINGIEYFNRTGGADVIIIGRGGGSIEDLWAFNSETLAYAIYNSNIPIISAVGHETDFTIADFVADVRAPTPSAAAELAVPDSEGLRAGINQYKDRLLSLVKNELRRKREVLSRLEASRVMKGPTAYIDEKNMTLLKYAERLSFAIESVEEKKRSALGALSRTLDSLSPLSVLSRGYSAVYGADGRVVKSAEEVKVGDKIQIRTGDGNIGAVVSDTVKSYE